jgi:heterodisulfide reductase subunit C/coenzyme F420-reducing hydrogenase delta subunit
VIRSAELDHGFVKEVLAEPGGEHLLTCSSCGTCAATCLVRRYDPSFNPRLILRRASLGMREAVLSSREIWECSACDLCYARCPKQIHISDVMKAMRDIAIREGYERPGPVATVNVQRCVACGQCVAACPYNAISLQTVTVNRRQKMAAQVDANLCMGCGICNAVCPSSSIAMEGYSDQDLYSDLRASTHALRQLTGRTLVSKVVAMVCQWCLRSQADTAVASEPPEGVEVVTVPCAGRVSPLLVLTALKEGADAVMIVGCDREECHFRQGSQLYEKREVVLSSLLDMMGVEPRRVRFAQMGSLDRRRFERLIGETVRDVPCEAAVHEARR